MIDIQNSPILEEQRPVVKKTGLMPMFAFIFLVAVFFVPLVVFSSIPILSFTSKLAVMSILLSLSLAVLLVDILRTGELQFPKSKIILLVFVIPLVSLVSALFSGNITNSIVGNIFEIGTTGSFLILSFVFLTAMIAGQKEPIIKRVIWSFIISMMIALLYTFFIAILQSIGKPITNLLTISLVGNYIDFSILLSVGIIFSNYLLSFSSINKRRRSLIWVFALLSLLTIGAIGFRPTEIVLCVFSIFIFLYVKFVRRGEEQSWIKSSYSSILVFIVSAIFIFSGTSVTKYLSNTLKVASFDVRPNVGSTWNVVKNQWQSNSIIGRGPNTFVELWSTYKPKEVTLSDFWNTDFFFGFGLVPTLAATTGILGLLSIAIFLLVYIKKGFNVFFVGARDESKFISVFTFLSSILLWIFMIVYTPGITVLFFTFVLSGLFVASLNHTGLTQNIKINIFSNVRTKFLSIFLIIVFLLSTVFVEYFVIKNVLASLVFNRAAVKFNTDHNIAQAESSIKKAISFKTTDLYYRTLSELYLLKIEEEMASIPANTTITETQRVSLEANIISSVESAKKAVEINPRNYQNHIIGARVYESLARRGIQGAAENSLASYTEALKLNPNNPSIQLGLARVSALSGNIEKTRDYINKAIEMKGNYSDAYFILAQLEAASNNVEGVIKAVESATANDPSNVSLFFQLGVIKYSIKDFIGAAAALTRATTLVPDYANAKYFLGLSQYNLGKIAEAISEFEGIRLTNPDNAEVNLILTNLKAGRPPFANAKPPIDSKPQSRDKLPIEENPSKSTQ